MFSCSFSVSRSGSRMLNPVLLNEQSTDPGTKHTATPSASLLPLSWWVPFIPKGILPLCVHIFAMYINSDCFLFPLRCWDHNHQMSEQTFLCRSADDSLLLICSMYKYVSGQKQKMVKSHSFFMKIIPMLWRTTYKCQKSPHFLLFTHHLMSVFLLLLFVLLFQGCNKFTGYKKYFDVKLQKL